MANTEGVWILLDKSAKDFTANPIPTTGDKILIEYKDNAPVWSGIATLLGNKNQSTRSNFKATEAGLDTIYSPIFFKVI